MRKLTMTSLFVLALLLAACGGTSASAGSTPAAPTPTATAALPTTTPPAGAAATVGLGAFAFTGASAITINAGQAVFFSDPSDGGGFHMLVTGAEGTFRAQTGAPTIFNSETGTTFNPGDSKLVTFSTAGIYTITCTLHPDMLVTITVTP